MWALIMTVYFGIPGYSESAATLAMCLVPTFESEQACRYAGAQQEVALRNDLGINTTKHYTFVCIKTKEQ